MSLGSEKSSGSVSESESSSYGSSGSSESAPSTGESSSSESSSSAETIEYFVMTIRLIGTALTPFFYRVVFLDEGKEIGEGASFPASDYMAQVASGTYSFEIEVDLAQAFLDGVITGGQADIFVFVESYLSDESEDFDPFLRIEVEYNGVTLSTEEEVIIYVGATPPAEHLVVEINAFNDGTHAI